MNVDAGIDKANATMGFGSIIRGDNGVFIAARGTQWSGTYSLREAEATSIDQGTTQLDQWEEFGFSDNMVLLPEYLDLQFFNGYDSEAAAEAAPASGEGPVAGASPGGGGVEEGGVVGGGRGVLLGRNCWAFGGNDDPDKALSFKVSADPDLCARKSAA
nr:uncharacterized protein LOC109155085 [Ipomoea batatas]